jgi:hypothetical protein
MSTNHISFGHAPAWEVEIEFWRLVLGRDDAGVLKVGVTQATRTRYWIHVKLLTSEILNDGDFYSLGII